MTRDLLSPEMCDRLVREKIATSPEYCALFIEQMTRHGWIEIDESWREFGPEELKATALRIYDGLLIVAAKNHNGLN